MSNLELANRMIALCNAKFCDGTGNLQTHPWDKGWQLRDQQIRAYRPGLTAAVAGNLGPRDGLEARAFLTGQALDQMPGVRAGNCGERSFWIYYQLRREAVQNVVVLTGDGTTSINHDFVVIGATNVASGVYSQRIAPTWQGHDIVICEPWHQRRLSFDNGVAYPLAAWPEWMPDIIEKTLKNMPQEKTLDRNAFHLLRNC
jgi:hypothetical protein